VTVQYPSRTLTLSAGVDVDMSQLFLADDFECTASEPINDIHVWASFRDDMLPEDGPGSLTFEISIYSDIPAVGGQRALEPGVTLLKHLGAIILTFTGTFCLIMGLLLDMPGRRKQGRIKVDEYHSTWEPTDKPFDTNWYGHDSGYNFYCIYDYCSRFYDMSRLNTPLDDAAVQNCDVLVVKVPTSRYDPEEIKTIERFVEQGGGLLLIGEHTNVFNTGTHINDIAKIFGFSFRYDCLFDIDTIYTQLYSLPLVPHPIIQSMLPFNFAVSCSIDPGRSLGRAVIRFTSLKNLLADYHASNFYPQVEDKAEMRYGAFVQLLTARHGAGRVVAFTDSTVFSNFATFEPGKAELMLGMLEWLNRHNSPYPLRLLLILLGFLFLAGGLALCRRPNVAWLIVVSAGVLGWAIAVMSTRAIHKYSMPLPKAVRPMVEVVVDRTVCDAPLSRSGFIAGTRDGFGIFERWILRLGYFTSRKRGTDALSGELIVFPHPNQDGHERVPQGAGQLCRIGRKSAHPRFAGEHRVNCEQPAVSVRPECESKHAY